MRDAGRGAHEAGGHRHHGAAPPHHGGHAPGRCSQPGQIQRGNSQHVVSIDVVLDYAQGAMLGTCNALYVHLNIVQTMCTAQRPIFMLILWRVFVQFRFAVSIILNGHGGGEEATFPVYLLPMQIAFTYYYALFLLMWKDRRKKFQSIFSKMF